jgi:hypothetical protein
MDEHTPTGAERELYRGTPIPLPTNYFGELASIPPPKRLGETPNTPLTPEQLACALYEGTPHLMNLAENLARQHGQAEALCPFDLQGQEVKDFWIRIANQLIYHAQQWLPNEGSACRMTDAEVERLRELSRGLHADAP